MKNNNVWYVIEGLLAILIILFFIWMYVGMPWL